jgi:RNA polymerase sigma-70 factor (ECF subfamily)
MIIVDSRSSEVRKMDYPEKELVQKSRNGDIDAFEKLIQAYEKRIFNIALKMVGNREDASDIAQEVCIKIYKSIGSFKESSSFSTWVYRITSNVCIDQLRKRKSNIVPLTMSSDDGEYELPVASNDRLPEDIVESRELSNLIKSCILELVPEQKIIITLRDIYGHSYEDIAKILNISMGTVKSRLNRARNTLKDKIKNMEPFKDGIV